MIIAVERVTRVLFGVFFGGLFLALAAETVLRRRLASRRRQSSQAVDEAYRIRPKTKPTIGWDGSVVVPIERARRSGV